MSHLIIIGVPLVAGLLISYSVRPRQWRKWLGILLISASVIAHFLLPLAPEQYMFVYVAAWATGFDLVLNCNRYVLTDV